MAEIIIVSSEYVRYVSGVVWYVCMVGTMVHHHDSFCQNLFFKTEMHTENLLIAADQQDRRALAARKVPEKLSVEAGRLEEYSCENGLDLTNLIYARLLLNRHRRILEARASTAFIMAMIVTEREVGVRVFHITTTTSKLKG